MKNYKGTYFKLITVLMLVSGMVINAQLQIKSLNISKAYANGHRTSLTITMPVKTDQSFFRLNMEKSKFTTVKDETGFDFNTEGKGVLKENAYTYFDVQKGELQMNIDIDGAPQKGAKTMSLRGNLVMEYEADGESDEVALELPFKDNIQTPIATQLGEIKIMAAGSVTTTDGTVYNSYYLESEVPFASVIADGNSNEAYKAMGVGLEQNHFVFLTEPEKVLFQLKTKAITAIEVPFELEFGIGF